MGRLGRFLDWIFIGVVLVCLLFLGWDRWKQRTTEGTAQTWLRVGDRVDPIEVSTPVRAATFILLLDERCAICQEEVPFYVELTSATENCSSAEIVTVSAQAGPAFERFLDARRIRPQRQQILPISNLQGAGLPTLLRVGSDGRVSKKWPGLITRTDRVEILSEIRAVCAEGK